MKNRFVLRAGCALMGLAASLATGFGAITPGNLVIYRVGDGSAALGTSATAVFLDEYTAGGAFVQSIALSGGASPFSAVGNATTEGIISRSQDGSTLIFTGYQKAPGGTSPSGDTYTVTPRVIGTLNAAGTVNTGTTLASDNGVTTANTIRSATSVDGTSAFWVSTSSRVSYLGTPGLGTTTTQIDARNSRQVNLSGNTLFAANGSTAITSKLQSYGTLPTGATIPVPVLSLTTADAINGFALFDLNAAIAGDDTLYALSTVANTLLKYTFDGTSWVASGSISAGSAQNLTGVVDGTTVNLFLTSGTTLYQYSDASGFGGTETGALSALTTAGANTAFRGIGMFVIPEPGSLSLIGLGLCGLLYSRRNRR